MKAFLFFLGSVFRWAVKKPQEFLFSHLYILSTYLIVYLMKNFSISGSGLVFTMAVLTPLCLAINRGLPLDSLSFEAALDREKM